MAENRAIISPADCKTVTQILDDQRDSLTVTPYQPEPILIFAWEIASQDESSLVSIARRALAGLQGRISALDHVAECTPAVLRCRQGSSVSPAPLPGVVGRAGIGVVNTYHRVDLACRVALSHPDDYLGGEIVLSGAGEPSRFKPAQGHEVLVAREHLTAIRPVHRGIRDELILFLAFDRGSVEKKQAEVTLDRLGYKQIANNIGRFGR